MSIQRLCGLTLQPHKYPLEIGHSLVILQNLSDCLHPSLYFIFNELRRQAGNDKGTMKGLSAMTGGHLMTE